jgi:plastocyanin domain-containing protein
MSVDKWLVLAAGLAAIAWLNWHFLRFMRRPAAAAAAPAQPGGVQQVAIVVDGGYAPDTIRVHSGAPVQLVFDRRETNACSEELVIAALGVRRFLPAHQRTAIDLGAPAAGEYEFMCGMGMLHGRLIVE